MTDLSLVLLDEIVEELKKRYDCFVLVATKLINKDQEETIVDFRGGKHTAVGLLEYAKRRIQITQEEEELEQDERLEQDE